MSDNYCCFKKDFIYVFLEKGEGREKERERNINMQEEHQTVASCTPPARDLAHNLGRCPDQESKRQTFGLWVDAQPTESHQSGLMIIVLILPQKTERMRSLP